MRYEKMQFESDRRKKISELTLKKATINYKKSLRRIDATLVVQENDLKIKSTKIFQIENQITDARRALSRTILRAPSNGLVEYLENPRTREKIKVGDEFYYGRPMVGIPDLSKMKVKTTLDELDFCKVAIGQKSVARLDAFPDKPFLGKIIDIARLPRKKAYDQPEKVFDVIILLDTSDPILRPGMTVRCEVITAELENVLFIENECICKENMSYYLYKRNKSDLKKCAVAIGPQNHNFTVVYCDDNLKSGDKIMVIK